MGKKKIFTILKEILITKISSQQLIVIILLGGFAFLIQATISHKQNLMVGYLLYVLIAFFSMMMVNWKEHNNLK